MTILFYAPHPTAFFNAQTGYGTQMREIVKAFEAQGHVVKLLILGGIEQSTVAEKVIKPEVANLKRSLKNIIPASIWITLKDLSIRYFDSQAQQKLEQLMLDIKPDILFERCAYMQPSGINVAKKHPNVRHILLMDAPWVEENMIFEKGKPLTTRWAYAIEKRQLQQPQDIVVVSSALKNHYIKKYKIEGNKIKVVPNAINFKDINVDAELKNKIMLDYDLEGAIVLGFLGNFFEHHGIDILIKIFDNLRNTITNLKLMIVGDGLIGEELRQFAKQKKHSKDIIFTGTVQHKDVFTYIDLMSIAIMPKTNWYCSPVKIFEYGGMKKPIIAPREPSVEDVMTDKIDGLLVSNEHELQKAIQNLSENENLRNQLAQNFYQKVKEHYTWDKVAQQILEHT